MEKSDLEKLSEIKKRISNFKNPETIQIESNVESKIRDQFYENINKMQPDKIIKLFAETGNIDIFEHDFDEMSEEKIKHKLIKLEMMSDYLKNKIYHQKDDDDTEDQIDNEKNIPSIKSEKNNNKTLKK